MAPTYTPMSKRKPGVASIPKVRGKTKATPMVAVRPGRAPIQMPVNTPNMMNIKILKVITLVRTAINIVYILLHYMSKPNRIGTFNTDPKRKKIPRVNNRLMMIHFHHALLLNHLM